MQKDSLTPVDEYVLTVRGLEDLFDFWNQTEFDGALEKPVITVCQDRRGRAYGWLIPSRIWKKADGSVASPEINMCSQYLDRPFEQTAATMLHEACHLYAFMHEIADTSSNGKYHTREYKKIAEAHGLIVERSRSHGYNVTKLSEESLKRLQSFTGERSYLYDTRPRASTEDFAAVAEQKAKSNRAPTARYTFCCPTCGQRIKAYSADVNLTCNQCKVPFEKEDR